MKNFIKLGMILLMANAASTMFAAGETDQRGYVRDSKPDIGAYEFKKVTSITLSTTASSALIVGNEATFSVDSYLPADADPTSFEFQQTNSLFSFTGYKGTALSSGTESVTAYSVDNPTLLSNAISFTITPETVGIDNASGSIFGIYPNPASDVLYFSQNVDGTVYIVNAVGQRYAFQPNGNQINISQLSEGIYIVTANIEGKEVKSKLVVSKN